MTSCAHKKSTIYSLEIISYHWVPPEKTLSLIPVLFVKLYCQIDSDGTCKAIIYEKYKSEKCALFKYKLDTILLNKFWNRVKQITTDTNLSPGWDCYYGNQPCMYSGPSYKFKIHGKDFDQTISFTMTPEKLFYDLYNSILLIPKTINEQDLTPIQGKETILFLTSEEKLSRFIRNNTEFTIPPPPLERLNEK
jgi:hypothetical protein